MNGRTTLNWIFIKSNETHPKYTFEQIPIYYLCITKTGQCIVAIYTTDNNTTKAYWKMPAAKHRNIQPIAYTRIKAPNGCRKFMTTTGQMLLDKMFSSTRTNYDKRIHQ